MEEMVKRENNYKGFIELVVSIVIIMGLLVAYAAPVNETGKFLGLNYNVIAYAIILFIAFVTFETLSWIPYKKNKFRWISEKTAIWINLITAILAVGFIILAYVNESTKLYAGTDLQKSFIREKIPYICVIIVSIVAIVGTIYTIRGGEVQITEKL